VSPHSNRTDLAARADNPLRSSLVTPGKPILTSPAPDPIIAPSGSWWLQPAADPRDIRHAFNWRFFTDRFGDAIQIPLAFLAFFAAAWPVSIAEIGAAPLVVCWLIRAPFLVRAWRVLLHQTPFILTLAFFLWQTASLLWGHDAAGQFKHWGVLRFLGAAFVLYPVLRHRGWFLLAMAAGFLCANIVQLIVLARASLHLPPLVYGPSEDGRIGGWWPNVVGGELLVCALGIHLGALFHARTRTTWAVGSVGAIASAAGILLSGTRGAWIAAAALFALWLGALIITRAGMTLRRAAIIIALIAVASAATFGASPSLRHRVIDARNEITRAVDRGEYQTNIGLRLMMLRWGWRAFIEHPAAGVGIGNYRAWVLSHAEKVEPPERTAIAQFEREGHDHCHNTLVQTLATSGLPGGILLVAFIGTSLWKGFRRGTSCAHGKGIIAAYAGAPAWMLLGTVLLWPFDAVLVSTLPMAMVGYAAAMCPGWLPAEAGDERRNGFV